MAFLEACEIMLQIHVKFLLLKKLTQSSAESNQVFIDQG